MRSDLAKKVYDRTSQETHQDVSDGVDNHILLSENTEVVSSAESESSVYTDVGESHASGDTQHPEALVDGALEKRTHSGNGLFCKDYEDRSQDQPCNMHCDRLCCKPM